MSLTNPFENKLQLLLFNNTDIANLGDATGIQGSTGAGNLWLALHTAMPDVESPANQSASEASYPSYARQSIARSGAGWTVTASVVSNTAEVQFVAHSGGSPTSQTVTHFSIGFGDGASPNSDQLVYAGILQASLAVSSGVNPTFAAGQLQITAD